MVDRDLRPPVEPVAGLVEEIHDVRHLAEDIQQLAQRDSSQALAARLGEPVPERAVGQLHPDDQPGLELPGAEVRQQVGVADRPEDADVGHLSPAESSGEPDDLEGDPEAAGGLGTPDVARASRPDPVQQAIAGQRFGTRSIRIGPGDRWRAPLMFAILPWLAGPRPVGTGVGIGQRGEAEASRGCYDGDVRNAASRGPSGGTGVLGKGPDIAWPSGSGGFPGRILSSLHVPYRRCLFPSRSRPRVPSDREAMASMGARLAATPTLHTLGWVTLVRQDRRLVGRMLRLPSARPRCHDHGPFGAIERGRRRWRARSS